MLTLNERGTLFPLLFGSWCTLHVYRPFFIVFPSVRTPEGRKRSSLCVCLTYSAYIFRTDMLSITGKVHHHWTTLEIDLPTVSF